MKARNQLMTSNVHRIVYTGENVEIKLYQDYFSFALSKEWFFSETKKCYGIPIRLAHYDGTGDMHFDVVLKDANNDLNVFMWDNENSYNAFIWIKEKATIKITLSYPSVYGTPSPHNNESLEIELSNEKLYDTLEVEENLRRTRNCYRNLEFVELWKLWEENAYMDGIDVDEILKSRLRLESFVFDGYVDSFKQLCNDFDGIFYVWCGLHIGHNAEICYFDNGELAGDESNFNGLKISATFNHQISSDNRTMDLLYIKVSDKDHVNGSFFGNLVNTSRISYNFFMDEINWENDLKSLIIDFDPDEINEVLKGRYIDIPVRYRNSKILLRLILDSTWWIKFILAENKLKGSS
jgi:hypothetical protein